MVKVFLDAGHGGQDCGASGNGLFEKDLTLNIVKGIDTMLRSQYEGVETKLSRTDDQYLSLTKRTDAANAWKADILLSVHINAAENKDAHGFESFTFLNAAKEAKALQNVMYKSIIQHCPELAERGQQEQNFHMLRESHMSSILTENGFISNIGDATLLKNPHFIKRLVMGHVQGIAQFAGLRRKGESVTNDYADHFAAPYIDRVKQMGIMQGYPDGTFKPDQQPTRGELAAVICRIFDKLEGASK